jgi:hypothetical protein
MSGVRLAVLRVLKTIAPEVAGVKETAATAIAATAVTAFGSARIRAVTAIANRLRPIREMRKVNGR